MTHMSKTTTTSGASQPIVFFGTEEHSLVTLRGLTEAGFSVAAVVTKPDSAKGRGRKISAPAVKVYAESQNIPVWQPTKLADITQQIIALGNPIGVLVSYGKIIPNSILELFTPGIINVHPSLLPVYRGPSPIESAIANRDNKTGVTIMKLVSAMDAGPIYVQVPYALDNTETKPELYDTLFTLGTNLLLTSLPKIINGEITASEQNESDATYCSLLTKADSDLDLTKLTPGQAEAHIRAYLTYPKTRLTVGNHQIIVTRAHGVMTKETPLDLLCANGAFLSIDELIAPSGKKMSSEEFLRGYSV